jgi:GDP-L-fucose synthase
MDKNAKIYVAGHTGLVGSALVKQLEKQGYKNLVLRKSSELDLRDSEWVSNFFEEEKPEYVFLAAARVGGILANNTYPAEFIYDNLSIQNNVIHQSYKKGVKRLLFLGSSCIYPKSAEQPLIEQALLTGELEETNRPYALAKIAGIEMCWSYNRQYGTQFLAAMPTNLFGPADNYDLSNSHVLPALMRKFHLAHLASQGDLSAIERDEKQHGELPFSLKQTLIEACHERTSPPVEVWGTGSPRREFMFSEDMAEACIFLMNLAPDVYRGLTGAERNNGLAPIINIGVGHDISIKELSVEIADVVGYKGDIFFDSTKPDGTNQKLMSVKRLEQLGWKQPPNFKQRLLEVYAHYLTHSKEAEA